MRRTSLHGLALDSRGMSAAEHGIIGAIVIAALAFIAPQLGGSLLPIFDRIIAVVQAVI